MAEAVLRAPREEELHGLAGRLALDGLLEVACPLDPAADARVAELGGQVVGTCWVRVVSSLTVFSADGTEAYIEGHVEPAHRGCGIGTALLRWAVARARATGTVREVFTDAGSADGAPLLAAAGFRPGPVIQVMEHDHPAAVVAPGWPAGTRLELRRGGDELVDAVVTACDRVFADLEGYRGATRPVVARVLAHPSSDPALCLLAARGREVVGLCYCRLERSGGTLGGWVEDLGVAPSARGIGLGRALLWEGLRGLAAAGAGSVLLGVDAANTTARSLYQSSGFRLASELARYRLVLG
ncbi:MAG TPA: GNAT family N-acetyltransferase [Actinomycetes bacterium]|nr:GNAT family N-acetyltransferase [Actinomycetes bacterium]